MYSIHSTGEAVYRDGTVISADVQYKSRCPSVIDCCL